MSVLLEKTMGNNTKPQVTIDGIEYDVDTFTDQQKALLDHTADLERKVASAKFNLDQLSVGRDAFLNMLKQSLAETAPQA
jgi:cytochrome b involved in lipid metabolism